MHMCHNSSNVFIASVCSLDHFSETRTLDYRKNKIDGYDYHSIHGFVFIE